MRFLLLGTMLGLMAATARADFVLQGAEPPAATPASTTGPTRAHPPSISRGFGQRVPLAFAVRQIVPVGIRIRYAEKVDQGAIVDWTGGKQWPDTLRAAVKQLGLRAQFSPGAVLITR